MSREDKIIEGKVPCPVCGMRMVEEFEVCSFCGWENDNIQYYDHDFWGGANEMSVNQAKEALANDELIY